MGLWAYLPCSKISTPARAVNFLPIWGLYDCEYSLVSKEWTKPNSVQFFLVKNSFVRTQKPSCNTCIKEIIDMSMGGHLISFIWGHVNVNFFFQAVIDVRCNFSSNYCSYQWRQSGQAVGKVKSLDVLWEEFFREEVYWKIFFNVQVREL